MNFKTGDKVIVITGKDKGNTGKIIKTLRNENKVIVEGLNIVKKHLKPNANNQNGGIVQKEAPIHCSNVMLVDPKTNKRTRTRIEENVKKVEKKTEKKVSNTKTTKKTKAKAE